MAITVHSPYAFASDLVTMQEASDLFAECGPEYAVKPRTLKQWAVKAGVTIERAGRDDCASWTDLLEVHRDQIDRRAGLA
ncbi:hypothetical protein [Streptomyces collinus]|uniref:hypothetical protein n=1 Tax=Streptomyces collinus TaxID=42684 RepID=UPI003813CDD1